MEGIDDTFGNPNILGAKIQSIFDVDKQVDFDAFINVDIMLPQNDDIIKVGTVWEQSTNLEGSPSGHYDPNPMFNT